MVEENMKAIVDGNTKEKEVEDFIISCLKNYATDKTLTPKLAPNATTSPVQATLLKSITHISKNTQP